MGKPFFQTMQDAVSSTSRGDVSDTAADDSESEHETFTLNNKTPPPVLTTMKSAIQALEDVQYYLQYMVTVPHSSLLSSMNTHLMTLVQTSITELCATNLIQLYIHFIHLAIACILHVIMLFC